MSLKQKSSIGKKSLSPARLAAIARQAYLRAQLPHTSSCLDSRSAHLIGDEVIADYVALDWLEWQGGGLRLTVTGRNVCNQVVKEQSAERLDAQAVKPRRRVRSPVV